MRNVVFSAMLECLSGSYNDSFAIFREILHFVAGLCHVRQFMYSWRDHYIIYVVTIVIFFIRF